MRMYLPIVGLVLLSIVTAVATRHVAAAVKRKGQRAAAAAPARITIIPGPDLKIRRAVGGPGTLDVEAVASILDPSRDGTFAWYLEVFRQTGPNIQEVAWQQRYDHQPLVVPRGQQRSPTFGEHLVMPPGDYSVEVGLTEWIRDANGNPRAMTAVSNVARVTVR